MAPPADGINWDGPYRGGKSVIETFVFSVSGTAAFVVSSAVSVKRLLFLFVSVYKQQLRTL